MSDDDEIKVCRLAHVRTMSVRADPRQVVLEIKSADGDVRYYGLSVSDLAGIAKQIAADAMLLGGEAPGNPAARTKC